MARVLFFITGYKVPLSHGTLHDIPIRQLSKHTGPLWVKVGLCLIPVTTKSSQHKIIGLEKVDFNLYNETSTGRAKAISQCVH